jgi:hypothetical protein
MAYKTVPGTPEGKRPLGRSRHRREDVNMDLTPMVGSCGHGNES